jgi:hypothetical protein
MASKKESKEPKEPEQAPQGSYKWIFFAICLCVIIGGAVALYFISPSSTTTTSSSVISVRQPLGVGSVLTQTPFQFQVTESGVEIVDTSKTPSKRLWFVSTLDTFGGEDKNLVFELQNNGEVVIWRGLNRRRESGQYQVVAAPPSDAKGFVAPYKLRFFATGALSVYDDKDKMVHSLYAP